MIEYETIKGTPFQLVNRKHDDNPTDQWFIVMGDYRMTEPTETKEETLEKLETEKWLLIFHIAATVIEKMSIIKIKQLLEENRGEKLPQDRLKPIITEDGGRYETESL